MKTFWQVRSARNEIHVQLEQKREGELKFSFTFDRNAAIPSSRSRGLGSCSASACQLKRRNALGSRTSSRATQFPPIPNGATLVLKQRALVTPHQTTDC